MYVDFKITAWERVEVSDEIADKVLQMIKDGEIRTANDLFEDEELEDYCGVTSLVPETEDYMTLEENGGASTIEVLERKDHENVTIYRNGNELED